MGLLQKACETYDANLALVGKATDFQGTLCPIGHILQKAQIEISLDEEGHFIGAQEVSKEDCRTIIPATEKAVSGRTGTQPTPYALCEQLQYLCSRDEPRHSRYLNALRKWYEFDPLITLQAVLCYVEHDSILHDLSRIGLYAPDRKIQNLPPAKWLVRWIINGQRSWQDTALIASFSRYLSSQEQEVSGICLITGEKSTLRSKHDKGIIAANNGAKLISSNDASNFTYRGRFTEASQACTISGEASQKAHRALQWVASTQSDTIGGRTFMCWNPQGKRVARPQRLFAGKKEDAPIPTTPTAYREVLHTTLSGYRYELPQGAGIVMAVFDAATTGRLSLTYYSEMEGSDFYNRVEAWYQSCCWPFGKFGIKSPPLKQIAECAFGTERKGRIEADDKLLRETVQRLLACMLNKARIPEDIVRQLFCNASSPQRYQEKGNRIRLLHTACAVIRKHRNDFLQREEWSMILDENKQDRSYQFGRLLAVMEAVERATYGREEDREPNAIRLQSVFNERPLHTAKVLNDQLVPYFARLQPPGLRSYYKNIIGQILAVICATPESEWNRPLEDTSLMGYYLQRTALYTKNDKSNTDVEEEEQ